MKNYGIDGVFVQRFVADISTPKGLRSVNVVLDHCREGANLNGRTYAVMYDLSGMRGGDMHRVMDDWKALVDRMQITKDPPIFIMRENQSLPYGDSVSVMAANTRPKKEWNS